MDMSLLFWIVRPICGHVFHIADVYIKNMQISLCSDCVCIWIHLSEPIFASRFQKLRICQLCWYSQGEHINWNKIKTDRRRVPYSSLQMSGNTSKTQMAQAGFCKGITQLSSDYKHANDMSSLLMSFKHNHFISD